MSMAATGGVQFLPKIMAFLRSTTGLHVPTFVSTTNRAKVVAMMLISSIVSQRILTKSGTDNLSGSESNLAKSEF